ncbi:MAG: hypothetical protein LQ340_002960 [Diploschistes diacapsis]|nr:MAG: hypothetical protein LQ340_002960 [Diploschistes diacapsis]
MASVREGFEGLARYQGGGEGGEGGEEAGQVKKRVRSRSPSVESVVSVTEPLVATKKGAKRKALGNIEEGDAEAQRPAKLVRVADKLPYVVRGIRGKIAADITREVDKLYAADERAFLQQDCDRACSKVSQALHNDTACSQDLDIFEKDLRTHVHTTNAQLRFEWFQRSKYAWINLKRTIAETIDKLKENDCFAKCSVDGASDKVRAHFQGLANRHKASYSEVTTKLGEHSETVFKAVSIKTAQLKQACGDVEAGEEAEAKSSLVVAARNDIQMLLDEVRLGYNLLVCSAGTSVDLTPISIDRQMDRFKHM